MTILVIDDSRFLQLGLERVLHKVGYRTIAVSDGEAGLRMAIENLPDLILLDVMLPSLPGTSVLRSLKDSRVTSQIPVIMLTGLVGLDEVRLRKEGADGYLAKSDLDLKGGCGALLRIIETTLTKASHMPN